MPGCFKKTLFSLASIISFASFIVILAAMGTQRWMTGKILCKTGVDLVNATDPELVKFMGDIYYGLFQGGKTRQCGLGGRRSKFTIFPHMVKKLNTGLHVMIIMFLCAALSFSLVSFGFCILNAIKVPYRAIKGPAGLCLWNFLAGGLIVLAVTSFIAAVKLHRLTERIANFRENVFQFVILEEQFEDSFWLCVASATAHAVNLLVIAISWINFPKIKTKTEEANVAPEDIMY
ncbi:Clarin-2 [Tinamus guttatus]|uniref:Clarin-2 n=1 Tax=Tinamus guttatus TaxID=94827 RepID=A0A099ZHT4_TINGU|nr:PREDICTED: clarin-2 [Tinamus guttatus]KGL81382.1 Clarin-2 [Tinamus guttatus]